MQAIILEINIGVIFYDAAQVPDNLDTPTWLL